MVAKNINNKIFFLVGFFGLLKNYILNSLVIHWSNEFVIISMTETFYIVGV